MSNSQKTKNIALRVNLKEQLTKRWELARKDNPEANPTFSGYINDLLCQMVDKEEFNKKYFPFLQLIGVKGNTVFIKDNRPDVKLNDTLIELYLEREKLFCKKHKHFDCEHVRFALAVREIGRIHNFLKISKAVSYILA